MASRKKDAFNDKTLQKIKAARKADPNWEKAIAAFVEAEATGGQSDPAEGKTVKPHHPKP